MSSKKYMQRGVIKKGTAPKNAPAKAQDGSRKPPGANPPKTKPSSDKR